MDLYLHFFISLGLTTLALLFLMIFFPSIQKKAPRFWDAEKRVRSLFITLAVALGFVGVVTVGIAKEWYDSYGFGDVEASDLLGDGAGVLLGIFLILKVTSRERRRKIHVTFSPQTRKGRVQSVNLFRQKGRSAAPVPAAADRGPDEESN